jgi:hypothetical protein
MQTVLNKKQIDMCKNWDTDYSDLKTIFINCTLKRSPEMSHTDGLVRISGAIMELRGVKVEEIRAVDFDIAEGVYPDMTEHGWTTFMTWNLMHLARILKDAGGIPAHGNQRSKWEAGCRSDFPNPDYR